MEDGWVIEGEVLAITNLAVKVKLRWVGTEKPALESAWFPISKCPDLENVEVGEEIEFECPEWMVEEKELY